MKKHGRKRLINPFLFLLAAGLLAVCGAKPAEAEDILTEPAQEDALQEWIDLFPQTQGETPGEKIADAKISTVFIEEPFYDGVINDEQDALEALYSVIDRLGGDENTELVLHNEFENDEETTFYCFEQALGGIQVDKGNVKLIVDKDGNALGIISTLVSGLETDPDYVWEITQEEAESIVRESFEYSGARVLYGSSEATVLWNDHAGTMTYVWVVYSTNPDADDERNYLAHYVSGNGEYLYDLPVFEPGDAQSHSGAASVFAFEGYEVGEWSGIVKDIDGLERTITVPLMIDQETGAAVLGDLQRKILCADFADYDFNGTLTPISSTDGTFINNELITYEMFIRIWDFYDNIGWHGPDAEGTPSLLLLNLVDKNGEPLDAAYYNGKQNGFQVFKINDEFGDGSCSDIIGHEFTHCVTGESLSADNYENDYGAINEAMSDIMGNLIEMYFEDSPGGEWLISERQANGTIRNMKDPHEFLQPEYVWDQFYVPNVETPNDYNDRGGVHTNSSLLNYIAYKLAQAGMPLEDQIYYWLNVDLSLTPTTDYPLIAKILPWCLDVTGYSEYKEALDRAIQEADLERVEVPEEGKNGQAVVSLDLPLDPEEMGLDIIMYIMCPGDKEFLSSWAAKNSTTISVVLPEGDYLFLLYAESRADENKYSYFLMTPDGWSEADSTLPDAIRSLPKEELDAYAVHLDTGRTELTAAGL